MVQWIEQRKMSFLKLVPKNIDVDASKKKQFLKNHRKKYKQMDISQRKTIIVKQNC